VTGQSPQAECRIAAHSGGTAPDSHRLPSHQTHPLPKSITETTPPRTYLDRSNPIGYINLG